MKELKTLCYFLNCEMDEKDIVWRLCQYSNDNPVPNIL